MTIIYILAILLQAGIIIYFLKRSKATTKEEGQPKTHDTSTYEGARATAIGITPDDLQLKIPDTQTLVYGVVMDWDMGGHVLTLAAYITGAANVYLSTGPSITGGGRNPEVGGLAVQFVTDAQHLLLRTMPVAMTSYPPSGCVCFYLLTNHGIYGVQEQLAYMENTTSPWLSLFVRGNTLLDEMKQSGVHNN